ncbi:hypothetical protein FJZ36_00885 [Candidatus Poribacteria bacterium]|nr:hypothetical protein [Candidatus Poribacteria bacterium]
MRPHRNHWLVLTACALVLAAGAVTLARAEVEKLSLHLYGGMTNRSRWQIEKLLSPYVDPSNIEFKAVRDKDGRRNPWRTIVEITPEGDYLDIYDIVHSIRDTRGVEDGRLLYRTDIEATGELRAHLGFTRRSFRWVPGWVQARGLVTSGLWHRVYADGSGEDLVFHPNAVYDDLRASPPRDERVRIKGRIAGFDSVYPVVVLGEYSGADEAPADDGREPSMLRRQRRVGGERTDDR